MCVKLQETTRQPWAGLSCPRFSGKSLCERRGRGQGPRRDAARGTRDHGKRGHPRQTKEPGSGAAGGPPARSSGGSKSGRAPLCPKVHRQTEPPDAGWCLPGAQVPDIPTGHLHVSAVILGVTGVVQVDRDRTPTVKCQRQPGSVIARKLNPRSKRCWASGSRRPDSPNNRDASRNRGLLTGLSLNHSPLSDGISLPCNPTSI